MKKLPVGIQTFAKRTEDDLCYVDKTPLIARLAEQDELYFLSRNITRFEWEPLETSG